MALFDDVFNKASIYEMLFFNVKAVLIYPTLQELKQGNPQLYERWVYLSQKKYETPETNIFDEIGGATKFERVYEDNAAYFPEYTRIVAITYATLYSENGTLKRYFKKIANEDEYLVIATFMDVLHELSSQGVNSTPQYFPIFCGHNIISYDIPLLIKRFFINREKFQTNKQLPYILKRSLGIKPWESGIVDTVNVWKFNGYDNMPLMLISDFVGLKRTVDLLPLGELSRYYWKNVSEKPTETLEFVSLQSATQTNLVIQLMNELRQL